MWNFDGSYQAEAQRRAELYAQAELLRAAQGSDAKTDSWPGSASCWSGSGPGCRA
jgi:hypothetical protein